MDIEYKDFVPLGWQCPICKRVYSPMMQVCLYCGNVSEIVTVQTTSEISYHCNCTHCGKDFWTPNPIPTKCPFCFEKLP